MQKQQISTQQLVIRIPASEKSTLESIAQKKNTTISKVAREALKRYMYTQNDDTKNHLLQLAETGKKYSPNKKPTNLSTTYKKKLYSQ